VDTVFPLDRGKDAFACLEAGKLAGKLVIEVAARTNSGSGCGAARSNWAGWPRR
jgi:hypothetical protein